MLSIVKHPQNILLPILVTPLPIVMLVSRLQREKTDASIFVILFGRVSWERDLQPEKVPLRIVVMPFPKVILLS